MARQNQESITTFGEVLHSSNISYSQNRSSANDNRLMIYFQGVDANFRCQYNTLGSDTIKNSNDTVFKYNKKSNVYSMIEADYLMKNHMDGKNLFLFLVSVICLNSQLLRSCTKKLSGAVHRSFPEDHFQEKN